MLNESCCSCWITSPIALWQTGLISGLYCQDWKYFGESLVFCLIVLSCVLPPARLLSSDLGQVFWMSPRDLFDSQSFLFHVGFSCSSWQPCTNQQTVSHKSLCGFPEAECTLYFKENNQGKTCSGLTLLAGHSPDCCLFRNFRNCLAIVWDPWISPKKDL